jgi:D-arabinose 1-dehydrogenase-like Zn-dependent alcohol dehydrogenase
MKAAVFHESHQPLTIENIEHASLKRREVLVRTAYAGLCHSDLHFMEGLYPWPAPAVLGREAAGVIEAVGDDVTYVKRPCDHLPVGVLRRVSAMHDQPSKPLREHRGEADARRGASPGRATC